MNMAGALSVFDGAVLSLCELYAKRLIEIDTFGKERT